VTGAWLLVEGAIRVALRLGVSEAVIGLTIVAIGTSLPELAASVAAARRGHSEIALGNVVGSNAFNLGAGLGLPALMTPLAVPDTLLERDLGVMAAFTVALVVLCQRAAIGRGAGIGLLVAYGAYVTWCLVAA
jgi:cation:H+ antiporter